MVPLLRRLHFYAGILVAPLLVIAALTGLAYTLTPQLDDLVYHEEFHVTKVGDQTQTWPRQVAAAQKAVPDGSLASISPPNKTDGTTEVAFHVPGLGEKQRTAYVDPYTGEVRGVLTTWFGSTPLTTWLDDLHRNLHLGEFGRHYSELAASWLWVLVLVGLVLWLNHQRGKRRLRRALFPDVTANKGVRRTRSWHASVGMWVAIGLLVLSVTGLTWSAHAGARFDALQAALHSGTAELDTTLSGTSRTPGSPVDEPGAGGSDSAGKPDLTRIELVLGAARDRGLNGPVEISPSAGSETAWVVAQTDKTWPVGLDQVAVDPATGTVTDYLRWSDKSIVDKLSVLGVQAHMGVLFGITNQIVLAVIAIGLLCMIFWGYRSWWQRRPTRADRKGLFGPPVSRGAWREMHLGLLVLGVVTVAVIGWAIPLLGWSLLGFLLLDTILGGMQRYRRHRRTSATTS